MSSTIGAYDLLVYLTDESGDVIERWTLGGNSYEVGYYVYVTFEGDYIITGYTNSFGTQGSADIWLLKIEGLEINLPPSAPTIDGPISGRIGIAYPYNFNSTDPNGDQVSYYIRWGDGTITDWTVLQSSGYPGYTESRSWSTKGKYTIAAKAKDEYDVHSGWTELDVEIPRNKPLYFNLFSWMFERFPLLEKLLGLIRVI
jgi:hypothetical protein